MEMAQKLRAELQGNSHTHAYLFIGDVKATTEATEILIGNVGCNPADISIVEPEMEASGKASEIKVEQIRTLLHEINLSPLGAVRIGVIKNVEKLNISSANVMLKTLEEPPEKAIIVLTATSESVLATIRSRCRVYRAGAEFPENHTFSYPDIFDKKLAKVFKAIEKIVNENLVNSLLDQLVLGLRDKMLSSKDPKYTFKLEEIEKVRKAIAGNANPRLALENLILFLRR